MRRSTSNRKYFPRTLRRIGRRARSTGALIAAALLVLALPFGTGCELERVGRIVAGGNTSADLSPWEFFCLVNADPGQDTADCLNGLP